MRYAITKITRNDEKIQAEKARYGWRVPVTNLACKAVDLNATVLLYKGGWSLERDFHILKDRPLGIQPL